MSSECSNLQLLYVCIHIYCRYLPFIIACVQLGIRTYVRSFIIKYSVSLLTFLYSFVWLFTSSYYIDLYFLYRVRNIEMHTFIFILYICDVIDRKSNIRYTQYEMRWIMVMYVLRNLLW